MSASVSTPTSLLPSPFFIIYVLPLIILSLPLIICGAFVTLDRTHTFSPKPTAYDTLVTPPNSIWRLNGGIGGITFGFVFGVHLITVLVLALENHTSVRRMSPGGFFSLWFIFALISSLICGRWKVPALASLAICGGSATALLISVVVHPSLLARLVFLLLFVIVFLLGTFLPIRNGRLQPWLARISAALTGSTTLVIAIALLHRVDGWAHALLRFVIRNENTWGGSKERGLSAAVVFFFLIGVVSDWFLSRKFGRDPSEKWDSYLSEYTYDESRNKGVFRPFPSLFQCCPRSRQPKEVLFPPDTAYYHAPRISRPARFLPHQVAYVPGILPLSFNASSAREESTGFIRPPPRFSFNNMSTPSLSGATVVDVNISRRRYLRPDQLAMDKDTEDSSPSSSLSSRSDVFDSDDQPAVGTPTPTEAPHDHPDIQGHESARSLSTLPTLLEDAREMISTAVESPSGTIVEAAARTDESGDIRAVSKDMEEEVSWEEFWRNVRDRAAHGK